MIRWRMLKAGLSDLITFVDNFFLIQPDSAEALKRIEVAVQLLTDAGVALHEVQHGPVFDGLGWQWDVPGMAMICPVDKHVILCQYLADWSKRCTAGGGARFTGQELDRCIGLLRWLSAGFSCGRSDLAHLVHVRTAASLAKSQHEAQRRFAKKAGSPFMIKLSAAARRVIVFWQEHFPAWDRRCPIVRGFSPTASWQVLGRVDASTTWGCGGFCFVPGSKVLSCFMHEWSPGERAYAMVTERESTTCFELMAAQRWMEIFAPRCAGRRVQLECDNMPGVLGMERGYSEIPSLVSMISRIRSLCVVGHICFRACHVMGLLFNKIADALSHNDFPQAQAAAIQEFRLPLLLER